MNDPIGDMLTRIRNAQMRGKSTTLTPASKARMRVLEVMADEGYIRGHEPSTGVRGHPTIEISLKYFDGAPAIQEMKRVSKPFLLFSLFFFSLPSFLPFLFVSIVSTSKGVMSDANARAANVGGEVLCTVF